MNHWSISLFIRQGVHMTDWTEEQRSATAKGFRQAGGAWHMTKGLTDPHGPLW